MPSAAQAVEYPEIKSIADVPRVRAAMIGDQVAISFDGVETSYRELDRYSSQVANGLMTEGVVGGDRIAVLDRNSDRFFQIWLGAAKANAVTVPVNARLAGPEVAFALNDANVKILFIGAVFVDLIAKIKGDLKSVQKIIVIEEDFDDWRASQPDRDPMLPAAPTDVALQMYTSGTTGLPKGVELTNGNFTIAMRAVLPHWGYWTTTDTLLLTMPLFHIGGCGAGLVGLLAGVKIILVRDFIPDRVLSLIEQERITLSFLVPAMIQAFLAEKTIETTDVSSVRRIVYGASPIPLGALQQALKVFTRAGFVQVYGLTETTGVVTVLSPEDHQTATERTLKSCGRAIGDVDLRVVDGMGEPLPPGGVGEIICRTRQNMKGYWNRVDATAATIRDGWLYTGDAGFVDENGLLYIHDRMKDMVVSAGENVYPAEIESVLYSHPDIADIAVIGVPDEKWGEAVKAVIVAKPGREPDAAAIIAYARERLAGYKVPKSIDFVEELPRNPTGKILKRELRAQYWKGRERQVN